MSESIHPIHTPCKKCVFAKYDNKTQTDCELKYLDIYRNKNIQILEAYDEDLEFYVVNDKKCIGYREPKWFDMLGMSNSTMEEKINKYNELNIINYVLAIDTLNMSDDQFNNMIQKIASLDIKPQRLVILRHIKDNYQLPYSKIEQAFTTHGLQTPWKIKTILDTELSRGDIVHQVVGENSGYRFLAYTNDYDADIFKLVSTANKIVYQDFDQFNILSLEDEANTIIFSISVYRYANFMGSSILENKSNYTII